MYEGSFKIYLESLYQNLRPTTFWEVIFQSWAEIFGLTNLWKLITSHLPGLLNQRHFLIIHTWNFSLLLSLKKK